MNTKNAQKHKKQIATLLGKTVNCWYWI